MIYNLHQYFSTSLTTYTTHTRISGRLTLNPVESNHRDGPTGHKNIFNKNERRCRDVKAQKACEQGWEATIGPKIKQTTSI